MSDDAKLPARLVAGILMVAHLSLLASMWATYADWPLAPMVDVAASIVGIITGLFLLVIMVRHRERRQPPPLIAEKAADDAAVRRRRDGKRWNERLKLIAAFLNGIGASSFLVLFIAPVLKGEAFGKAAIYGLAVAIVCHLLGHVALSLWKTEE